MIPYTPPKFNIDPVETTIFEAGGLTHFQAGIILGPS